jgi:hypothetical protein
LLFVIATFFLKKRKWLACCFQNGGKYRMLFGIDVWFENGLFMFFCSGFSQGAGGADQQGAVAELPGKNPARKGLWAKQKKARNRWFRALFYKRSH